MTFDEIKKVFQEEFGVIAEKFNISELSIIDPDLKKNDKDAMPGVYVIMKNNGVIKVGRSLDNSRKRALNGWVKVLGNDPNLKLLLFNVKTSENRHWVAALEIFFEKLLKPKIQSDRKS